MANVFISFRYCDGIRYKSELSSLFDSCDDTFDFSEDENRSGMSDGTIKDYLYSKLRRSSVTIVLLTPLALNHKKSRWGIYDDWMYDEIRYSLEDRENNRRNGLIAVYTPEVESFLFEKNFHTCEICKKISIAQSVRWFDNLVRYNMFNIKQEYKRCNCVGLYDESWDSYCSLVSFEKFKTDYRQLIQIAFEKRSSSWKYDLRVHL